MARLADTGRYLGSETSFYSVSKQNDLLSHRHNSKPRVHCRPKDLAARSPNQVWSCGYHVSEQSDPGHVLLLYLVEDIFSRKIVGWTIEEVESADHAGQLIDRICHGLDGQRTADAPFGQRRTDDRRNHGGYPGAIRSDPLLSRPAVSDDNPYSESSSRR